MKQLIESSLVSLDGFVSSPQGWALPMWDEENKRHAMEELAEYDAFLLGRVTYELFANMWGPVKGDPYIDRINAMPKYVASRTLEETKWNATLLKGDVVGEVRRLKEQGGKALIKYGTSSFDKTLFAAGLVDEVRFSIFPVLVGRGTRVFDGIDTGRFTLALKSSKTFANGVVRVAYRVTPKA